MVRQKMAESIRQATLYIEQGHIRVGPETITDPAYLVTRNREDFVTWVDSSKIKTKIMKYNDKVGVQKHFLISHKFSYYAFGHTARRLWSAQLREGIVHGMSAMNFICRSSLHTYSFYFS